MNSFSLFYIWSHWVHHISAFFSRRLTWVLIFFVRLQTLVQFYFLLLLLLLLFFFCFSAFCEFQCPFYKTTIILTFIVGIFHFFFFFFLGGGGGVRQGRLKSIKLKFFLPNSNGIAIQNHPFMQLRLIFQKTVDKNKLKA